MSGVAAALDNNSDAQPKGVKAHFEMDSSGILQLTEVCVCVCVCVHA